MLDEERHDLSGYAAYLSIGSNIGAREAAVLRAVTKLEEDRIGRVLRHSSLYETEPVDCEPMNDFVNTVVELHTLLWPEDLLKRLQALEKAMGRRRGHNEPRELDIDIITLGDRVIHANFLTVPHPRYRKRAFVLVPLREVAPDFRCPDTGQGIDEMLSMLPPKQVVTRITSRRMVLAPLGSRVP